MEEVDGKELYGMDICKNREGKYIYPTGQLDGSAYWVPEETFRILIEAILKQLSRAGFKIVVGHGHGPSTGFFRDHAEEFKKKFGLECMICWCEEELWNDLNLGIQVDHAAANETSLVMAMYPDLVQMERLPEDKDKWPVAVGGADPREHASVRYGEKCIEFQKERMAGVLKEALLELKG